MLAKIHRTSRLLCYQLGKDRLGMMPTLDVISSTSYVFKTVMNPNGTPSTVFFEYSDGSVVDTLSVNSDPFVGREDTLVTIQVTGLEGE